MSEILCRNVERGGRIRCAELDFMGELLDFEISDAKSCSRTHFISDRGPRIPSERRGGLGILERGVDILAILWLGLIIWPI
jgi:hypothetical protein